MTYADIQRRWAERRRGRCRRAPNTAVVIVTLATAVLGACSDDGGSSAEEPSTTTTVDVDAAAETQAFCDRARSLDDAVVVDPLNPDPDELRRTAAALDELSTLAPESIRPQITATGELVGEFADLLASVDPSDPNALADPAVQQRLEELGQGDRDLGAGLQEIGLFVEVECGQAGS